jgi:ribosome-associated protein
MTRINDEITIDGGELDFVASRSAGPGGQNVNKVSTRITLRFEVAGSPSLAPGDKERILERLATRINNAGVLRVTSQRHRTQAANREAAAERFAELVRDALEESPERRPTRVPRVARRKRLDEKRRRGRLKKERAGDFRRDE